MSWKPKWETYKALPLDEWVAANRLSDDAMATLARTAIRREADTTHIDVDAMAAWARSALIRELVDGEDQLASPFADMLAATFTMRDELGELSIEPDDGTPTSSFIIRQALLIAASISGASSVKQIADYPSGKMVGGTPRARKAAARFIRLVGARVQVETGKWPFLDHKESPSRASQSTGAEHHSQTEPDEHGHVSRGRELTDKANDTPGGEAERLYDEASKEFAAAVALSPQSCRAHTSWAHMLIARARSSSLLDALRYLDEAERLSENAMRIRPDFYMARVGLGHVQLDRARLGSKPAMAMLDSALAHYQAALDIDESCYAALAGVGSVFLERARRLNGPPAQEALSQAEAFFLSALEVEPSLFIGLNGLGETYLAQSRTLALDEAEAKLDAAFERYRLALEIKPNNYVAHRGIGDVLVERAQRASGPSSEALRREAKKHYRRALEIQLNSFRALNPPPEDP